MLEKKGPTNRRERAEVFAPKIPLFGPKNVLLCLIFPSFTFNQGPILVRRGPFREWKGMISNKFISILALVSLGPNFFRVFSGFSESFWGQAFSILAVGSYLISRRNITKGALLRQSNGTNLDSIALQFAIQNTRTWSKTKMNKRAWTPCNERNWHGQIWISALE